MKCNTLTKRKINIYAMCIIIVLTCALCTYDVKPPKANPYKEDKAIHHSLYREKDSIERMSSYAQSIPLPQKE